MAAAPPLPVDPDAGFSRPRGVPALPGYKGLAVGDEVKENDQGTKYREVRLSDAEGGGKVGVSSKGFRALTTRPDGSWNMDSGLTMILCPDCDEPISGMGQGDARSNLTMHQSTGCGEWHTPTTRAAHNYATAARIFREANEETVSGSMKRGENLRAEAEKRMASARREAADAGLDDGFLYHVERGARSGYPVDHYTDLLEDAFGTRVEDERD